ncbi:MAG: prepilin-type N-terminal cleavage/methylation domain-containing protein [Candidatus Thiodiazotropha sp. (ex Monitilora ramsayi)]|nr:prepilin-type N-terminal cleavage/methylation domain-containing protein [Candidatus Thiodiazotropha sp. (ex Monitilora ramsayi)]
MTRKQRYSLGRGAVSGLSLIEVLVAFVILSMVMSVILRINATSLRNHDTSKQYLKAVQIAQSRMVEMSTDAQSFSLVKEGADSAGFQWRFVRQPHTGWTEDRLQSLQAEPVEEQIEISWGEEESRRQISFSRISLIYPSP